MPHVTSLLRCDDADVTSYAAHLRVYEPLAAFEGEERRRWEQYLRAGNIPSVAGGLAGVERTPCPDGGAHLPRHDVAPHEGPATTALPGEPGEPYDRSGA